MRRGKEGWRHGESNLANTEAWKAARGRLTGGGVSAQKGGGEAGEAGCLQSLALKELQCPRIEGAGYRGLKRGKGAA
jgi:hypothetical protein